MKLSDLLKQKLTIDSWNITPELLLLDKKLSIVKDNISVLDIDELAPAMALIDNDIHDILNDLTSLVEDIEQIQKEAHGLAQEGSREPLGASYDLYEESKDTIMANCDLVASYRKFDQFANNADYEEKFISNIKKLASWQYSTVYVRPNSLRFFDALKASDILYVMEQCDTTKWLKQNLESPLYDTIRFKLINEKKEEFMTNSIPAGQIGLIVMEHFINFKPFDIIRQYLDESFTLLKPGGHLMFTYNDCDLHAGVRNFENGLYCFTPGSFLSRMCELTGFEIESSETSERISWFVLKKPGVLTSIKAGKTVGVIKYNKPKAQEYDPAKSQQWNQRNQNT